MDFSENETNHGYRMTWNTLPGNRVWFQRLIVPASILYTPNKDINAYTIQSLPLKCSECFSIFNPYCPINYQTKSWKCPICLKQMTFPSYYANAISPEQNPPEHQQDMLTVEYLQDKEVHPPGYIFVVDKCIDQPEMDALKIELLQIIDSLPEHAHVALVSFDKNTFVHDLQVEEYLTEKAQNGEKLYKDSKIAALLGFKIFNKNDLKGSQIKPNQALLRLMPPVGQLRDHIKRVINSLKINKWTKKRGERLLRCTGSAINLAVSLGQGFFSSGCSVFGFLGGACTHGPGKMADTKMENLLRSHVDQEKDSVKMGMHKKAKEFYKEVTNRCISNNVSVCIFAFSQDQNGFAEMKDLVQKTGNISVMHEQFQAQVFKESIKRVFSVDENGNGYLNTGASIEMSMSKSVRVQGAIGPCISLNKKNASCSELEIGESQTTAWFIGSQEKNSTICFVLDVPAQEIEENKGKSAIIQFRTTYKTYQGHVKMRVTTIQSQFGSFHREQYKRSFDQEAAITCLSRIAVGMAEGVGSNGSDSKEIMRWLDMKLIQLYARFGNYNKGNVNTFKIDDEFSLCPQFIYYLRKSHFVSKFATSVDECAYWRSGMLKESTGNVLVMIQPTLYEYDPTVGDPRPVPCDTTSMRSDIILLVDTFYNVIIWHGNTVAEWVKLGYDKDPNFEHFKTIQEMPHEDLGYIMEERFPAPKRTVCDEGDGKERLIKSKLNPAHVDTNTATNLVQGGGMETDHRSLKYFQDYLIKVVVNTETES